MTSATSPNPSEWIVRFPHANDRCVVRRDLPYASIADQERLMDVYLPLEGDGPHAAVIIASGYPTAGLRHHLGRSARHFGAARSWGELCASYGVAEIAYDAVDPIADLPALIDHVRRHADTLGLAASRLGLFACSGNAPVALANCHTHIECAVVLYGFTFDDGHRDAVARAARQFGFANPQSLDAVDRIPQSLRMLIVRAGLDAFDGLNEGIDAFVAAALARNLPLTLINHANAVHAFDLLDEGERTRRIIRDVLQFLKDELSM